MKRLLRYECGNNLEIRDEETAMPDKTTLPEGTKSEKAPGEKVICLYPGCENEAVGGPRKNEDSSRQGPPPRYCEDETHNAASTYQALKKLEEEAAAG
jgi:hypothetical protein